MRSIIAEQARLAQRNEDLDTNKAEQLRNIRWMLDESSGFKFVVAGPTRQLEKDRKRTIHEVQESTRVYLLRPQYS